MVSVPSSNDELFVGLKRTGFVTVGTGKILGHFSMSTYFLVSFPYRASPLASECSKHYDREGDCTSNR